MRISINGGIGSLDEAETHLHAGMDGVMIGRAAYQTPWAILGDADRRIFDAPNPFSSPDEVVEAMYPYISKHLGEGGRLNAVTRHMLGLFAGRPGARLWRRTLSEGAHAKGAGLEIVEAALGEINRLVAAE